MTNHPKQKELNSFLWQAEHGWKYDPLPQEPAEWSEPHTQTPPARTKGGEAEAEAEFNALFGNIFQKGRLMKNKGTN